MSFSQGVFPNNLKTCKFIPLFKKGDSSIMSNYRPVALCSIFSKIIEKLMGNRPTNFLQKYKILYEYQFGFCKGHSTSLALFEVK